MLAAANAGFFIHPPPAIVAQYPASATPKLQMTAPTSPTSATATAAWSYSAICSAPDLSTFGARIMNSSPPQRQRTSCVRMPEPSTRASSTRALSPTRWGAGR